MDRDFDVDHFLRQPLFAHLATSSDDGPRESPVWFLWEDHAMWLVGNDRDSFPKRLRVDGRCAVGVVDFDLERGLLKHVGIRGIATVLPLDFASIDCCADIWARIRRCGIAASGSESSIA